MAFEVFWSVWLSHRGWDRSDELESLLLCFFCASSGDGRGLLIAFTLSPARRMLVGPLSPRSLHARWVSRGCGRATRRSTRPVWRLNFALECRETPLAGEADEGQARRLRRATRVDGVSAVCWTSLAFTLQRYRVWFFDIPKSSADDPPPLSLPSLHRLPLGSISPSFLLQVPVWAVLDYTRTKTIERELLLAKVSILGPEYFEDQLANKGPDILPATEGVEEGSPVRQHIDNTLNAVADGHPGVSSNYRRQEGTLTPSEALRQKHTHLASINTIAQQFGGKIVDLSNDAVIVEMTGKTARVDAFLKLVRPYGILEAARSGGFDCFLKLGFVVQLADFPPPFPSRYSRRTHGHAPRFVALPLAPLSSFPRRFDSSRASANASSTFNSSHHFPLVWNG